MTDLQQRLRELSKVKFEQFVHAYLNAIFPGADIKAVDGSGGDAGIDCFSGNLGDKPAIWQAKHFPDRIKPSQQKQILKSIKTAMKHQPILWSLCIPIDLRTPEHKWFQDKIVAVYGGNDKIKLIQASDFLSELQRNRELRDAFFPENALSSMRDVRKIVTETENKTSQDLGLLTVEYAQQYLESAMSSDPRLQAVIAVGGTPAMRTPQSQDGLVLSVTEGEHTVHFFARYKTEYNRDPIKFNVDVSSEHRHGLQRAMESGVAYKIPAGALLKIESSSKLIESFLGATELSAMAAEVKPQLSPLIANRVVPMRFVSGQGSEAKNLSYVPFKVVRIGHREIEMRSDGPLPMVITLVLRVNQSEGATINIRPQFLGSDAIRANQVVEFLDELARSGLMEVFSLDPEKKLLSAEKGSINGLHMPKGFKRVVALAAVVSNHFRTPLHMPDDVGEEEFKNLEILSHIATGEDFFDVAWNATWTKSVESSDFAITTFRNGPFAMKIDHPDGWRLFEVFGQTIEPGPISFVADNAVIQNLEKFEAAYEVAKPGDAIEISFQCAGPCRFIRLDVEL